MSATEELRRLLDERGVEWWPLVSEMSECVIDGIRYKFRQVGCGLIVSTCTEGTVTPAQAIAATLGAEDKINAVGGIIAQAECHDVCNSVAEFTCSACGFNCDITSWISLFDGDVGRHRHHHHGTPNYCPNCGRRVEADDG
jgi:hypothetical protein